MSKVLFKWKIGRLVLELRIEPPPPRPILLGDDEDTPVLDIIPITRPEQMK